MDQSKWTVPRMRGHVMTKNLAKYQRPRLKLHAVWIHKVGLFCYLVDPRLSADASITLEEFAVMLVINELQYNIVIFCLS